MGQPTNQVFSKIGGIARYVVVAMALFVIPTTIIPLTFGLSNTHRMAVTFVLLCLWMLLYVLWTKYPGETQE